jgi:response regulator RpfG family c-di-GMP phosphodiesterase
MTIHRALMGRNQLAPLELRPPGPGRILGAVRGRGPLAGTGLKPQCERRSRRSSTSQPPLRSRASDAVPTRLAVAPVSVAVLNATAGIGRKTPHEPGTQADSETRWSIRGYRLVRTLTAHANSESRPAGNSSRAVVLCVDDDPVVLSGLDLQLSRRYDVLTASSGSAGLAALAERDGVAVVISDMHMPGMDGATFLRQVRESDPGAVRVLLTGGSDLTAAVCAVNEGQIFRFLTKPCSAADLVRTVEAAIEHHRLVTAERVLLEETLRGSIKALLDVLALANPTAFGQANRVKGLVSDLVDRLAVADRWQVEVAAMLASLGCVALPPATLEGLLVGRPLNDSELAMVRRVPAITDALLRNIPRLEGVRAMITGAAEVSLDRPRQSPEASLGAAILRVAADFDQLVSRGDSPALALETLRSRGGRYHHRVLDALATVIAPVGRDKSSVAEPTVREMPMAGLMVGMVLATDLRTATGVLIATRGFEVTLGLVERAANLSETERRQTVRVLVRSGSAGTGT